MKLCDYGCGQKANYQFKNGKYCCSENIESCLFNRKKHFDNLFDISKNSGYLVVSKCNEYINKNSIICLKCLNGHVIEVRSKNIFRNKIRHCEECRKQNLKNKLCEYVKKRNGKILSELVNINFNKKVQIQCENGHVWETQIRGLLTDSSWCKKCEYKSRIKYCFKDISEYIKSKGGTCLTIFNLDEPISLKEKIDIQCENGHIWKTSISNLMYFNIWCKKCSNKIRSILKMDTIENMNKIAFEKNGKCLSKEYKGNNIKLEWECKNGHRWWSSPSYIKNGCWCKICNKHKRKVINLDNNKDYLCDYGCGKFANYYFVKSKKYCCKPYYIQCSYFKKERIKKIENILKNSNKILLSSLEELSNLREKIKIKCSCGNIYEECASDIKEHNYCKKCKKNDFNDNYSCYDISDLHNKAKEFNCICLSKEYNGAKVPYPWKCCNNHPVFFSTWLNVNIHNQWCPYCTKNTNEQICRFIFDKITGKRFIKTKRLIKGFEIDGYCEELKLAFEYNGEQHYREIPYFHRNKYDFEKQIQRDKKVKINLKKMGINLIVIPYKNATNKEKMQSYILNKLIKLDIDIFDKNIDWDKFNFGYSLLEKVKKIAGKSGFEIISKNCLNVNEDLTIKCNKCGKLQKRKCASILNNGRNGNHIKCGDRYSSKHKNREFSLGYKNPKLSLEFHPTKNKDLTPYDIPINSHDKIWWKCLKYGHEWEAEVAHRHNAKSYCPECSKINKMKNSGIHYNESSNRYIARLTISKKSIILGSYKIKENAIFIREKAIEFYSQGIKDPQVYYNMKQYYNKIIYDQEKDYNKIYDYSNIDNS